jgi:radical SAM protein with 4Fe4S-binding SPASM domain
VSFGSDIGLKLSLATNGLLLSEEKAMELKKAGLNEVLLPIDGVQETHDRIRGEGSFEGVMRAARAARKAGIELVVDPCISKWNLREIDDILDISEGLGAKGAIFFHFIPLGRGVCFRGELSEDEYVFSSALAPGCRAGIAILCVKPDGNVTPCPNLEISVGNIRKKSLNELWNASLLQKLRKREVGGRCGDCRYKDICGGCRARAFVKYNDPFAEDPLCGFFEKD